MISDFDCYVWNGMPQFGKKVQIEKTKQKNTNFFSEFDCYVWNGGPQFVDFASAPNAVYSGRGY